MTKAVLFDFDGTIADSFSTILDIFYRLTGREMLRDPVEVQRLRTLPLMKVGHELHIKLWRAPWLMVRGRRRMTHHIADIPLFDGMAEVIRQLDMRGYQLYIISSGSRKNIRRFLKAHDLQDCFVEIYGGASLFGKAKLIKKLLRRCRLAPDEAIYIGDEVRDIEAARHASVPVVSVAWGFNDRRILQQHQPDMFAEQPQDIINLLER